MSRQGYVYAGDVAHGAPGAKYNHYGSSYSEESSADRSECSAHTCAARAHKTFVKELLNFGRNPADNADSFSAAQKVHASYPEHHIWLGKLVYHTHPPLTEILRASPARLRFNGAASMCDGLETIPRAASRSSHCGWFPDFPYRPDGLCADVSISRSSGV